METAVKAVDGAVLVVVEPAHTARYGVIADHGNADRIRNEDGSPNTTHSAALMLHLIIKDGFKGLIQPGKSGNVAHGFCV